MPAATQAKSVECAPAPDNDNALKEANINKSNNLQDTHCPTFLRKQHSGVVGMEKYAVLELVGEGSFGKVYRGRVRFTGQAVALKFISKAGKSRKDLENLRVEMTILQKLQHDNVIRLLETVETEAEFVVVTEFAHGELFEILENDGKMPEKEVCLQHDVVSSWHHPSAYYLMIQI